MIMSSETHVKGDTPPFYSVFLLFKVFLQKPMEVVMMWEAEKLPNVLETQAATSGKAR